MDWHVEAVDEATALRGRGPELFQPAGLAELSDLVGRRVVRRAYLERLVPRALTSRLAVE